MNLANVSYADVACFVNDILGRPVAVVVRLPLCEVVVQQQIVELDARIKILIQLIGNIWMQNNHRMITTILLST